MLRSITEEEHAWRETLVTDIEQLSKVAEVVTRHLRAGDYEDAMNEAAKINHASARLCNLLAEAYNEAEKEENEAFSNMMGGDMPSFDEEGDG